MPLSTQFPTDADLEQLLRRPRSVSVLGANVLNLLVVIGFWGQWRVLTGAVLICAVLSLINSKVFEWLARRFSVLVAEMVRVVFNAVGLVAGGTLLEWSILVWVFLPYNMLWFTGLDAWNRWRMVFFLVVVDGVALWQGCDLQMLAAFSVLGLFAYLVTEKHSALMMGVLKQLLSQRERLQEAHQELQVMHERALEQEKLASLGKMAAGVAHEINNPMSYVTSNVNWLLRDLRKVPQLPRSLQEYVDDVLPATLDGIRRVNAIVMDLRRFARGDSEAFTEFDFDAELQSALRIAQGELSHCQVETDLQKIGTFVGRPQQITQVLVQLFVNAGHAVTDTGRVLISSRREGDMARVDVRDTGVGMSSETMKRLFEPFFTTKPPGKGMGLGLAAAHGIVTSHGGRIEVESELQKGARFTLFLPCCPPSP
ncbi:sensor histidine kinase [Stigmatella aurantiaca]|uniref:histidine kinase n=1 Tax=Stigmatella aurantiaca (strain DW4/3-1) TaxID=378806 RepID=Q09C07_STIAD|nr:ATP-binding protein [Stigmatella aurantiaca]ADO74401.1 Sensor protein [Stigmatella aurantiaca DW4/3-1]EAU69332.1 PAS [Stigmatella aurantiaca DW4/3-1]